MEDLPTYWEYKAQVDSLVSSGQLTTEQAIILLSCFNATLNGAPVHINYLMHATGLGWKPINWTVNGLVQRGAIKKIEQKYYMI